MLRRIKDDYDSVKEVCRRFYADEDPVYEDKLLPMYTYQNNTEYDLDRIADDVLYIADRFIYNDSIYFSRHMEFIEDTKYLAGFFRENNYNKEDK